jgi:hypothetical protein
MPQNAMTGTFVTGVAFCREKIAMTAAKMIMMTIVNKVPPS